MAGLTVPELLILGLFTGLLGLGLALLVRRPAAGGTAFSPAGLLQDWDRRVANMPQHADLRSILDRLGTVERVCDVVRAEMSGVKDAVGRVEKLTNLLLEHHLDDAK